MKKLLLLLLLLPLIVAAQKGSIKGNVYFKFNDYVGDKADAGSKIVLLKKSDTTFKQVAKADLQGNYSFSDLDPDQYLVIIRSNNARYAMPSAFNDLDLYSNMMGHYCNSLPTLLAGPVYDDIKTKSSDYLSARISRKVSPNKLLKMSVALNKLINSFYDSMPDNIKDRLNLNLPFLKIDCEEKAINDKEISIVTDFGSSEPIL